MDERTITLTIAGMALVTCLPRLAPLLLLTGWRGGLPPAFETWLRYVPAAVLAAMLLPSLLISEQRLALRADNLYLWAALPTLAVAYKTRSLLAAVLIGVAVVAGGRLLLG